MNLKLTCLCGTPLTFLHVWHACVQHPSASEGFTPCSQGRGQPRMNKTDKSPASCCMHSNSQPITSPQTEPSETARHQEPRTTDSRGQSEESKKQKREEKAILVIPIALRLKNTQQIYQKFAHRLNSDTCIRTDNRGKCSEKRDWSFQRDETWHWPPKCFIWKACELLWQIPPDASSIFFSFPLYITNQILLVSLLSKHRRWFACGLRAEN